MSKAKLLIFLFSPLPPHQEICWLYTQNRSRIYHSSLPHRYQPDPSHHHLLPGVLQELSNRSPCFHPWSSTTYSQQRTSDPLKYYVKSCNLTSQNPPMTLHFSQTKAGPCVACKPLYNVSFWPYLLSPFPLLSASAAITLTSYSSNSLGTFLPQDICTGCYPA